ncbi:MAG TPA: hypothetical protein PL002_15870 [Flavobacteriales bacterium]|jgi:hypothetical protein|nr:hypothetical protein [Flavobacteriales bacterium]
MPRTKLRGDTGKVLVKGHGGLPGMGSAVVFSDREPAPIAAPKNFFRPVEQRWAVAVERGMTKKDKIAFIRSSKRKTHVYNDLHRFSDNQLNELIREIVQGLVRESEIIANAYINGYR